MALTLKEIKNKVLADMTPEERLITIVAEVRSGGYILLGLGRVFEIYESGSTVYVSVRGLEPGGWEDYEV